MVLFCQAQLRRQTWQSVLSNGYASPSVFSLNAFIERGSLLRHFLLPLESGFLDTIHNGELYGDVEAFIIFLFSIDSTCRLISSLWIGGNRRNCLVFICRLSVVVMRWSIILVWLNSSSGNWNRSLFLAIILCTWSDSSILFNRLREDSLALSAGVLEFVYRVRSCVVPGMYL